MTCKEKVLAMFETPSITLSCHQICRKLIELDDIPLHKRKYLSGSISSILYKLVRDGVLQYSNIKTNRRGHIYEISKSGQKIIELEEEIVKLKAVILGLRRDILGHNIASIG